MVVAIAYNLIYYQPVGYFFAPLLLGLLLGFLQKFLFLRGGPAQYRWWPLATGLGAVSGVVVGICTFTLLSLLLVKLFPGISGAGEILISIILIGGSYEAVGVACSLFQFWLFKGWKAVAYLTWAWISSAIAGSVALGGWLLYDWFHAPFSCPVAAGADMMFEQIPLMMLVAIFFYGLGTSIVLKYPRKQVDK